ncbi:hypothetical protein HS041_28235 [Planomonospora sp. ID67723]|uniref:hypothetical protein n=1 Tax=Planomonospora sp. ID67723 TaxID=2738134 RepID=UPI0018C3CAE3|nr:hypothetical protein [Planomonospora sp. ID67723]MBG0831624.1 hypothetical protein [Planomonospora sp. ID67723]
MSVSLFMVGTVALSMIADSREPEHAKERFAAVMDTAVQIANPDYRFHGFSNDGDGASDRLRLTGEPLAASDGIAEDIHGDGVTYEVTRDSSGKVDAGSALSIGDSALDQSLMTIGERDQSQDAARRQARKRLDALPAAMNAVALVEFERPLTASQLVDFTRRHGHCGMTTYIYRPFGHGNGLNPENAISWHVGMNPFPDTAGLSHECEKEPEAALASYRSWVAALRPQDDAGLRQLALTRAGLADAAGKGVAHAFVAESWILADLRALLDDPQVRTVRVTDVAFNLVSRS